MGRSSSGGSGNIVAGVPYYLLMLIPTMPSSPIATKHDVLLRSLREYYTRNPREAIQLYCVVSYKSSVSLRILDWLVTNYAKSHNTVYAVRGKPFNVYLNYKASLKAFSKRAFDPFARRDRLTLCGIHPLNSNEPLVTTVAQLNFFRWCFGNGVLAYALDHEDAITRDMVTALSQRRRQHYSSSSSSTIAPDDDQDRTCRRRRRELSRNNAATNIRLNVVTPLI